MSDIPNFPGPRQGSVSPQFSRARAANMPQLIARSRERTVRNRDVRGAEHVMKGRTLIQGVGEASVDIQFPVVYIEAPIFTFGGELAEGSALEPTNFPTINAIVFSWILNEPDLTLSGQSLRTHYRGARLAVVTTGPTGTDQYLHWTFTGRAISNPGTGRNVVPPTS